MLSTLRKIRNYLRYFGFPQGLGILARESLGTSEWEVAVRHPSLRNAVTIRTSSSDIPAFVQVIVNREYDVHPITNVRTIVDAGANIGLAALYYAETFPGARIICLEPGRSNFALLSRNLRHWPNVTCLKKALWSESGALDLFDPRLGFWGFRTGNAAASGGVLGRPVERVDCVSVGDLMAKYELDRISLLKVDIEGAEKEVFEASDAWIDRVDAIAIELHDGFKRGCSKAFYDATAAFAREVHKGESVFVFR